MKANNIDHSSSVASALLDSRDTAQPSVVELTAQFTQIGSMNSAAEMKTAYRATRSRVAELTGLVIPRQMHAMHDAQEAALLAIARKEVVESGRPAPSDQVLKARLAKALDAACQTAESWLAEGTPVKIGKLESTEGMMVRGEGLKSRAQGQRGTLVSWVPGHGGDVWWVKHQNGSVGAYSTSEMKPERPPAVPNGDLWLG